MKNTSPLPHVHLLPFPPNPGTPETQSPLPLRNPEPAFHQSPSRQAPPGPTWPLAKPSNPSYTANILCPSEMPTRTAARTAAFMPAAGAPTFTTPTLQLLCKSGAGAGGCGSLARRTPPAPGTAASRVHVQVMGWRRDSGAARSGWAGVGMMHWSSKGWPPQSRNRAGQDSGLPRGKGEDQGGGGWVQGARSPTFGISESGSLMASRL